MKIPKVKILTLCITPYVLVNSHFISMEQTKD